MARRDGLLALAALALSGCTERLDSAKGEAQIRGFFERKGLVVENVDCPRKVELAPGASFVCTIRFAGSPPIEVAVTQLDERGNARFRLTGPVVITSEVTPKIEAWIQELAGVDADVDCGAGVQPVPAGGYRCRATLPDGGAKTILVRVDDAGAATWSVGD